MRFSGKNPEKTHVGTGRTCKVHTARPEKSLQHNASPIHFSVVCFLRCNTNNHQILNRWCISYCVLGRAASGRIIVYAAKDTRPGAHQEVVEVIRSQISFGVSWQAFIPVSSHVSRCVLDPNAPHSVGRCHTPVRNLIGATSWSGSLINREQTSHQLTAVLDTDVISSLPEPALPPFANGQCVVVKSLICPQLKKKCFCLRLRPALTASCDPTKSRHKFLRVKCLNQIDRFVYATVGWVTPMKPTWVLNGMFWHVFRHRSTGRFYKPTVFVTVFKVAQGGYLTAALGHFSFGTVAHMGLKTSCDYLPKTFFSPFDF